MRTQIKNRDIDCLLINFVGFALKTRSVWEGLGLRVFVHIHGYDIAIDGRSDKRSNKMLHDREYVNKVLELSKDVEFISNSKFSTSQLIEIGVPPSKIHLKYFGVEQQNVDSLIATRRERSGPVRLLYVGRLIDFKGPVRLLKCFERLRAQGVDATLTMAGDGELSGACEKLYRNSSWQADITLLGALDYKQVQALYEHADVFVNFHHRGELTNREEAFGVTIIEAMSYGLPVVTGASGGVCESIVDGVTGYLVPPEDESRYVATLAGLCSDKALRLQMGADAVKHVREYFSVEQERARIRQIVSSSTCEPIGLKSTLRDQKKPETHVDLQRSDRAGSGRVSKVACDPQLGLYQGAAERQSVS